MFSILLYGKFQSYGEVGGKPIGPIGIPVLVHSGVFNTAFSSTRVEILGAKTLEKL